MPSTFTFTLLSITAAAAAYFLYTTSNMPSLPAIRASNAQALSSLSYIPVAFFIGGTSGIGQGMAHAFATHTKGNANIIIIGRNRAAAEAIIADFPKPTVEGVKHEFVECDISLMKNVKETTAKLIERYPKVNFVALTAGIMTTAGRTETVEGIDRKLAVHYYGRWKFIQGLLDGLKAAKSGGEDARVITVMAAGKGGPVDLQDLPLKNTFSIAKAATVAPTYNDLMMEVCFLPRISKVTSILVYHLQELAIRHPEISFTHSYPGFVRTPLAARSDSRLLKLAYPLLLPLTYPLSTSLYETGDYMLYGMLNYTGKGMNRVGSRGEDIQKKRWFGTAEERKALWEHTWEVTKID